MIKILHAADLHLDSAFAGRSEAAAAQLRGALRAVPEKLAELCRRENCDLLLLAGDLFDGGYSREGYLALRNALEEVDIPVFITPGNHDFCGPGSPWTEESWPKNVHIFKNTAVESVAIPALDCRVYGGGFTAMDCPALLEGFRADGPEKYHIGVFHGDPTQATSPYDPVSQAQVAACGLDYLALGHVHKMGQMQAGKTLCAWPGCPMGRGFDELEQKGVLVVTVAERASARFVPLDGPRFYDWEAEVLTTAREALARRLPAGGSEDHYRITLTGECEKPDLAALAREFEAFPNLELRDRTQPPVELWASLGTDSLEGVYFQMLHEMLHQESQQDRDIALLAAKISRSILDGREVALP